ncbi:hypothetical protein VNO77_39676 [Canavalia gladiata]|uniref:RING-type domain-containing protein n=1 Tax=Canavalia gladiata TaxID=3824 RepID=A0AAN9JWT6_CANGL
MSPLIRMALAINFISGSHTFTMLKNYLTLLRTLFHSLCGEVLSTCHHVSTYVSREIAEDCAVCLSKMGEKEEQIVTLRCEHCFHTDCFHTWIGFNNKATCPLCRDSLLLPHTQILPFHSSSLCEIKSLR